MRRIGRRGYAISAWTRDTGATRGDSARSDGCTVPVTHERRRHRIRDQASIQEHTGGSRSRRRPSAGDRYTVGHAAIYDGSVGMAILSPLRITVLMGGASAERDVSLASGLRIVEALSRRGHKVIALDPAGGV